MGFLKKYYKGIERGESSTKWRAIELADEEIDELWKAINKLRKRVTYDEADEVKLEERVDKLKEEIEVLKERVDDIEDDVRRLDVFTEGDGDIDGTEEEI